MEVQIDNDIIDYLREVSGFFERPSLESVVLEHGRSFPVPKIARPKGIRKGRNRACFMNAYHVAHDRYLTYVEGFAISDVVPFPFQHAWVVNGEVVIETTWKKPGLAYFGIPLDFDFIHAVMMELKIYGALNFGSETFRERFL